MLHRLIEILSEPRHATKENVERKQARTDGEREEEEEDVVEVKQI
jgi:splicing factor 3A subunit 3